jgi:hypothetical protein
MSPNIDETTNRRNLIKGLTAAGGVAATGLWAKPIVNSVMLPVHAQISEEDFSADITSVLPE